MELKMAKIKSTKNTYELLNMKQFDKIEEDEPNEQEQAKVKKRKI